VETLTLPLRGAWSYGVQTSLDSQVIFSGTIVAQRAVPEPGTGALVVAGIGLLASRRRRI